jgi:hypothetical protein
VQPPPQSSAPSRGAQLPSPQPSDSRPSSSDANKALSSQPKYRKSSPSIYQVYIY